MNVVFVKGKQYREAKKAEWIKQDALYICSNCNKVAPYYIEDNTIIYWKDLKYCPYCGARMEGRQNG